MSDLYIFNPTGEMAIANGMHSFMPPRNLVRFEEDLAFLPSFYASDKDIVYTPRLPEPDFLALWHKLGLPHINYSDTLKLPQVPYNYLRPWSWTPAIHHKTKHLKPYCSVHFKQSPNYMWKQSSRDFFSRETTNRVQCLLNQDRNTENAIVVQTPAINISSIAQLDVWLAKQHAVILKTPWSSSGRGIHVIDPAKGRNANYAWIKGALKQQGFVTAEPLLDKVFDFSFQLNLRQNGEMDFSGISYSINDSKQHFIGAHINWPYQANEISELLTHTVLEQAVQRLIKAIKKIEPHTYYQGPIGVDAIVYRTATGNLKIHPCIDINWRYNMGLINISMKRFVHPDSIGTWRIASFAHGKWNNFIEQNRQLKPLHIANGNLLSGFINMTPPNINAMFGVWMDVRRKPVPSVKYNSW
ncbi:hypothetical protein SAMN06265379_101446 [Saccharicrinis carchari]|uniref:ATP-grasp domain-containing protein n=1 Tax=Saccharicrinis carchari TaxID=1168039 RepID=A0A521AVZ0_SACCC|nr:hypothetical protein [Saccharicrinis carchari]SMO38998.1 hypothetical protein SAMN06265379_101446 [Saccharicrinis carchari]